MATERRVTHTDKDEDGDILAICNPGSTWKRRTRSQAVADINGGEIKYYVQETGTRKVYLHVYDDEYLRTNADASSKNNLVNLPDC